MNERGRMDPLRVKLARPSTPSATISRELETYLMYQAFVGGGRQIFDLTEPLVALFRHTSVDDVPVRLLTSPYRSYYLHFGRQAELEFNPGWHADGAYVQHIPEAEVIQFLFTSVPDENTQVSQWTRYPEPSFVIAIGPDQFDKDLGEAVAAVLAERRSALAEKVAKGDRDRTAELAEYADRQGESLPPIRVIENAASVGKQEQADFEAKYPVMQRALEITVNAMCYLTAYPDDIVREWPSDAPKAMVDKATRGNPKARKSAQSKLESLGYHRVQLCGRALRQGPPTPEGDHKPRRTHWRRGHWKRQPHGPGRTLRKLVLIKPTLINPGEAHREDIPGTIYIGPNVVDLRAVKQRRERDE